jgi:hypothetical protein
MHATHKTMAAFGCTKFSGEEVSSISLGYALGKTMGRQTPPIQVSKGTNERNQQIAARKIAVTDQQNVLEASAIMLEEALTEMETWAAERETLFCDR